MTDKTFGKSGSVYDSMFAKVLININFKKLFNIYEKMHQIGIYILVIFPNIFNRAVCKKHLKDNTKTQ